MATERDLLSDLREVLGAADVDATGLVEAAWADARDEVHQTLKRLMVNDLLSRSLEALGGRAVADVSAVPEAGRGSGSVPADREPAGSREPAVGAGAGSAPRAEDAMTYVFGIVGPDVGLPADELPALPGGGELRFVDGPGCRALVSDVASELFDVLREPGPEGLDLLAAAAHAHDQTLAHFAGGPVLPLGLGTALADDEALGRLLTRHAAQLRDELARIGDHAEWAVTVRTQDPDEPTDPDDTAPGAPTSGRDYLKQRRAALHAREERWELQDRLAAELHGPLAACAVEAQRVESRPLEDAEPPLLHGVYLLDAASHDRFESTIAYLRSEYPETAVEVSGPWPPYHFVSLNLAVDGEPSA
jgi:hypothetical protein